MKDWAKPCDFRDETLDLAGEGLNGGDDGGDEADVVEAERAIGRERGGARR